MTIYPPAIIQGHFRRFAESWGFARSGIAEAYRTAPGKREELNLVWDEKVSRWAVHYWDWSLGADLVAHFIGPESACRC